MKKSVRILTALILSLLITASICLVSYAEARDFDMEKAISEFSENPLNVKKLSIGDTVRHNAALWADGGACYSSNEAVVTVDENGNVTAKGLGTAYVVIVASTGMYQTERYDVVENAGQSFPSFGTNDNFDDIINGALDDQDHLYEEATERMSGFFVFFWIFFSILLAFVIYTIITMIHLSSVSMKKRELPPVSITPLTAVGNTGNLEKCPKCGRSFSGSQFCPDCGTNARATYTYRFPIDKRITGTKFETAMNEWFAQNPNIEDCKVSLDLHNSLFSPFVYRKFFVKEAIIEFTLSEKPQSKRFGMAFLYKFRPFGPIGYSEAKQVRKWNENNPDCEVISSQGGRIQHFDSDGGIYAQYYNYVLFKK